MFESLKGIYDTLSTNPIAAAVILTPLISGTIFILTKKVPNMISGWLISTFSTGVTIYQAMDHDSFDTGEYILLKKKMWSPFRNYVLRNLKFMDRTSLSNGTTTFYGFMNGWFVSCQRSHDPNSKFNPAFVLYFRFYTKDTKALDAFFEKMNREKEQELLNGRYKLYVPQ